MRQVLLPAAEKQARRRKEAGRFKKGGGRRGIWASRWLVLSLWREVKASKDTSRMVKSVERGGRM